MKIINEYLNNKDITPLFIVGDSLKVLTKMNDNSVDCVITSPPYFGLRTSNSPFDECLEVDQYVKLFLKFAKNVKRVLKEKGSFWLNIGDVYINKSLALVPSIIAFALIEKQGWIIRNDIIWDKISSNPSSANNRLPNSYEHLFHFVKSPNYYYYTGFLSSKRRAVKIESGRVVSSSGVSGVNYRRKIASSILLTHEEKSEANIALDEHLEMIKKGDISDFRMFVRGDKKIMNLNREDDIKTKGFFFVVYKHSKPRDIWSILPAKRSQHNSSFPEELCLYPILSTCPPKGVVLDIFCGSGTSNIVAFKNKRKSIGIDINENYINLATSRIGNVKTL